MRRTVLSVRRLRKRGRICRWIALLRTGLIGECNDERSCLEGSGEEGALVASQSAA